MYPSYRHTAAERRFKLIKTIGIIAAGFYITALAFLGFVAFHFILKFW